MEHYNEMKKQMIKGWNTWNVRSTMSYVHLPEGCAITLGIKEYLDGDYLNEVLIGRNSNKKKDESIHPGAHAYDGSYMELNLKWRGLEFIIQSAVRDDELVVMVTPVRIYRRPPTLIVESGILWNRKGYSILENGILKDVSGDREIKVYTTGKIIEEPNVPVKTPYLAVSLDKVTGISTNRVLEIDEIKSIINENKVEHLKKKSKYGEMAEIYNALQSCIAWDTIYDPKKDRAITPVSRLWCGNGYVLFCWDTYFAALMASVDNKELAYSNAIEITGEKTERGFVPNVSEDFGFKSRDRSQPPVGSMVVREIYRKYKETWLLEELFDSLFGWNTWYFANRQIEEGLMAWGTTPYEPLPESYNNLFKIHQRFGAALESGLDNSPMYDDMAFNQDKNCMELADVGLMGLFIMDCDALAEIADILGRSDEKAEIEQRADKIKRGLETLWNEESGMYLNKKTDTGEFSKRLSPTNFYALFSDSVGKERADRMLREHFYNEKEFWGEWIIPSIARNDPAYHEQDYWRGRIWAPLNFLVYLAFKKQGLKQACRDLADKSAKLILKEWTECGHIHENYCADIGEGCNKQNSDRFYHWGALLSYIALMEEAQ